MIADFLSEPQLVPNPHYRSAPPMQLWLLKDVERVMRTKRFKAAQEERATRSAGARKAVATKRQNTAEFVDAMIERIHVKRKDSASKEFRRHVLYGHELDGKIKDLPAEVYERWAVNYIRHKLTRYDVELFSTKGKVGVAEEYLRYKEAVLDAIKQAYPEFADECEKQKTRAREEFAFRRSNARYACARSSTESVDNSCLDPLRPA